MCQRLNESIPGDVQKVHCYRMYDANLRSIHLGQPMTQANLYIKANDEPFHAFRTIEDVKRHAEYTHHSGCYHGPNTLHLLFECCLRENLLQGEWSDCREVMTYTGFLLNVIRCIGFERGGEVTLFEERC